MSMEHYDQAKTLMLAHPDQCHFAGPRSPSLINKAELALGLEFPPTYRRFLLDYGAGAFDASEIYGVITEDFVHSSVPDAVWYALRKRKTVNLPSELVVIQHGGDDEVYCLDTSARRHDGECPVIAYYPGFPLHVQTREIIAEDFGAFLLIQVRDELEDSNANE